MRASVRPASVVLAAVVVTFAAADSRAQAPPAGQAAPAVGKSAVPGRLPNADQVLATVNGEKITRGDLFEFMSHYDLRAIPPEDYNMVYHDALETLINMRLVPQFLSRLKIPISEERVDRAIADLEQNLKQQGGSLQRALVETNKSLKEVRNEYATRLRWLDYIKQRGTEAELRKFADAHKDDLNGTQVRASHILLRVEPKTSPADKEKMRQKLLGIKREIESKKLTFAQAANKYSQDTGNSEGSGGDVGYFPLNGNIIDEFGRAAFALKVGQISDPVETPYGFHLIVVTDRKEGPAVDVKQQYVAVQRLYEMEVHKEIVNSERKSAKIEIKPMPADLFKVMIASEPAPQPQAKEAANPKDAQAK